MSLINRAEAIDQLHQSINLLEAEDRIKDMPSAQTSGDLISRESVVDAIEHYINEIYKIPMGTVFKNGVLDGYCRIRSIVNGLPSANQWIPCSERLPQTNVSILYCTNTGAVGEGRYEGYNGLHSVWKMYAICGTHWDGEVIAWMPLPTPYKGDE